MSLQCHCLIQPYLIVVSSVRYSYVDISYSILAIILLSRIVSFPQFFYGAYDDWDANEDYRLHNNQFWSTINSCIS